MNFNHHNHHHNSTGTSINTNNHNPNVNLAKQRAAGAAFQNQPHQLHQHLQQQQQLSQQHQFPQQLSPQFQQLPLKTYLLNKYGQYQNVIIDFDLFASSSYIRLLAFGFSRILVTNRSTYRARRLANSLACKCQCLTSCHFWNG